MKSVYLSLLPLFASFLLQAQSTGSIKGTIRTSDDRPAAYVHVALKNTNNGATTNSLGSFEIKNIAAGDYMLITSSVGLETREQNIVVYPGQVTVVPAIVLNESASQLSEIVVEGEETNRFNENQSNYIAKMPLKKMENPQVYSSIGKDLMVDQMVFSVDEATKNAPGLQKMWEATGRGGDGGSYYNSRGFILQSQLRNGIAGNVSARIDAANLESIEVIKGPSATLFGSTLTSYGGLINRITKKPHDTFGGEVSYAGGSYSFNRISTDVNAPLNEERTALFRLNAAYNYEGSFQDNGFDKGVVVAPSFSYQVNDRLSVSMDTEMFGGTNTSRQMVFFYFPVSQLGADNPRDLGIDYKRSYSANDISQESRNTNFFGQINYKLSDQWTSQTNFTRTHSYSDGHYAYFYVIPNAYVTGDANDTGADYLVRADQSTANSTMDVSEIQQNFIGQFNIGSLKNRLVVGLDYFHENSNQLFYGADFDIIPKNGVIPGYSNFNRNKLDSVLINGTPWTWPYEYQTNTYSAYASDVINITSKLIAMAALRVDHFDNKGNYNEASGSFSGGFSQTAFSPKFGLVYQPVKEMVSLFANYQNGFNNVTGSDVSGNTFKPEQATQLEAGVKLDLLEGKVSGTVSYYDITVSNMVRPDVGNPNFSIQDGSQISRGFEAEVIANPIPGFNIVAGFSHNDSEMAKADADVEGLRPGYAMSPQTANLWMSYKLPAGKVRGLGVGFGGNYASENKIVNSVSMGTFTLPAYTVLNATVYYDQPVYRVGLKVDNLTNQQYWIGYGTMNPQRLRSVTGSVSFKF